MPQIVEVAVFGLSELSEDARDKARDWYRQNMDGDDWFEFIYDDFAAVCAILGVSLKTRSVSLMDGGTRLKPLIYFRGFESQGDGACFEASYSYRKDASRELRAHAPVDAELHRIADVLQTISAGIFTSSVPASNIVGAIAMPTAW